MNNPDITSSTNQPRVAIVVLSYNGKEYLDKFLPGVIQTDYPNLSVYVIDNASTDETAAYLKENFSSVNVIRLNENLGFAKGYNHGLKHIEADYFVILNQDVEVVGNWLKPIIDTLEQDSSMAICQPKILSFKNKEMFEYAGAAGGMMDIFGYTFCRGRLFDLLEEDHGQYDETASIFWASGACMVLRSKVFEELDGLDETFFMHMEEIEFCWRVHNAGYSIGYQPESKVYHVGGDSLPQGNPLKTYLNFRNSLFMMFKNLPFLRLIFTIPLRIILDDIAALRALLTGDFKSILPIFHAHISFVIRIPRLIRSRLRTRGQRKDKAIQSMYKGSIVLAFFIGGKKKFSDL